MLARCSHQRESSSSPVALAQPQRQTDKPLRTIYVASRNPVKINAVEKALGAMFGERLRLRVEGRGAPSGVPNQPFGDEETLLGWVILVALKPSRSRTASLPWAVVSVWAEATSARHHSTPYRQIQLRHKGVLTRHKHASLVVGPPSGRGAVPWRQLRYVACVPHPPSTPPPRPFPTSAPRLSRTLHRRTAHTVFPALRVHLPPKRPSTQPAPDPLSPGPLPPPGLATVWLRSAALPKAPTRASSPAPRPPTWWCP